MSTIETQANEDAEAVAKKHNRRYFELSNLLRYTFKSLSPYDSRRVRLRGRRGYPWRFKERIRQIAYRGSHNLFGMGGVVSVMGGNRPFVWMADDGALVVLDDGRYKIVGLMPLISRLTDNDYDLLVLWLSNDTVGALNLIEKHVDKAIDEMASL